MSMPPVFKKEIEKGLSQLAILLGGATTGYQDNNGTRLVIEEK